MARRAKEEYERLYAVTESRLHERGYTEYRVTAEFVSKKNPKDMKEIVVWKRYSDLKKLHSELSYTHRNLFRRMEEFPAFPKAQVFGRFEPAVIEERRRAAEAMLMFTVNIPALSNSPHLKEFLRGGEVRRRSEVWEAVEACSENVLPPPLVPQPSTIGGTSCRLPEIGHDGDATLDVPETMTDDEATTLTDPVLQSSGSILDRRESDGLGDLPDGILLAAAQEEALDLLFDSGEEEPPASPLHCLLSENELALFDPCCKEESATFGSFHEEELASLVVNDEPPEVPDLEATAQKALWDQQLNPAEAPQEPGPPGDYLTAAAKQIKLALKKEGAEDYVGAIQGYRDGVDLLLKGVQGDTNPARKEAVKKKMCEYLKHAEGLVQLHLKETQP